MARVARESGLFEAVFDGTEGDEAVIAWLRGRRLPSYEETLEGVARLAEAWVLDVISLGVDQNTQEHFFRPAEMDPRQGGAGGVPIRSPGRGPRLTALAVGEFRRVAGLNAVVPPDA